MKTTKMQSGIIGILCGVFTLIPISLTAQQREKRNHHQREQVQYQRNDRSVKPEKAYGYDHKNQRENRQYKSHKNSGYYYTKQQAGRQATHVQYANVNYKQHADFCQTPRVMYNRPYKTVYNCLPAKAHPVYFNGRKYYHSNHVYYMHNPGGGFVIVQPPKYLARVPKGSIRVNYNGQTAFVYAGIYFTWTPYGYIIL